ncbi:F0F1 ATP synthase subunit delta [Candidatus Curtissbacteria bacterium]|nr:F0F1 ATP synthase subunit delta [Candidatus Curtissbacteria bacterium]
MDNQKAQRVLETVVKNRPQGLSSILKLYKRLVTSQLNLENLIIETGAKIKNAKSLEKNLIAKTGARKVTYKTNPEMVFGARVMQGDWIWEENLSSKLKQLITNNE